jgi:uncharacterized protein YndB with AHSA1/START domain
MTAAHELTLTRLVDAPRSLVFATWTNAEHMARWWGPKGYVTTECEMDIRPGGAYRFVMRSPEGTDHRKRGVFREIAPPERVVFTFAWEDDSGGLGPETLITVTLAEIGSKTRLTLRQSGFTDMEWRDSHVHGWTSTLEKLAEYVTAL